MKKAITILMLCVAFVIIYFLQLNFFSHFTIAGIMPNLFVLFVLFIGLYIGEKFGAVFGIIFGTIIDFIGSNTIGISAVALGVVGFLGRILRKKFIKR